MPAHDSAARRRSTRHGRRRGCSIHLSGDELAAAGIDPNGPPPDYQVWIDPKRPRVMVNLYAVERVEVELASDAVEAGVSS